MCDISSKCYLTILRGNIIPNNAVKIENIICHIQQNFAINTEWQYLLYISPNGTVVKSSANGLVGTGFTSRYQLQPRAGF